MPASPSDTFSLQSLNECTLACTRNSRWKETTQRYLSNLLLNNLALMQDLQSGNYRISHTVNFRINERGKIREIEAPVVRDRTVHKALCKYVLAPRLTNCLIYDNYASLPGRGTSFARKRFETMLRRFYAHHGTDGYILLIDIRKYFASIDHNILKQLVARRIADEHPFIQNLVNYIIDTSNNAQPASVIGGSAATSSHTGLNLGAEPPQLFAIYYLNEIDQYVKTVRSVKYYGRYMDDIFILGHSKRELQQLLSDIESRLATLHLHINHRKTHISPISRPFIYLQIKYTLTSTGRIIKQPSRSKIIRERRRLKAHQRLVSRGRMTVLDALNCYRSWRGSLIRDHNACHRTLRSLDAQFCKLFPDIDINNPPRPPKPTWQTLIDDTFSSADPADLRAAANFIGTDAPLPTSAYNPDYLGAFSAFKPYIINSNPFIHL